jgi:DNA-binding protein HU-beta
MTKREMIEDVAVGAGITKDQAGKALDALLGAIQDAMKGNNARIALPGFGTFSKVHRKARKGINPATGETITIKARNAVKFQASKALKEAVS